MQNCGNSCYISSIIFAMFNKNMQGYDGLLHQALTESGNKTSKAQTLQFFLRESIVAPLRKGQLVDKSSMKFLRQLLVQCNWQGTGQQSVAEEEVRVLTDMGFGLALAQKTYLDSGQDLAKAIERLTGGGSGGAGGGGGPGRGQERQEDAHELLLFLLDVLQAPRLTIHQTLFHGGHLDSGQDYRVITARCFELAMEPPPSPPFPLPPPLPASAPACGQAGGGGQGQGGGEWEEEGLHGCLRVKQKKDKEKEAKKKKKKEEEAEEEEAEGARGEEEEQQAGALQRMLWNHFFEDHVSGMERQASGLDPAGRAPNPQPVHALKVLRLDRLYCAGSEIGTPKLHPQAAHFPSVLVPLVLQRYSGGAADPNSKDARAVGIPEVIDFSDFVASDSPAHQHVLRLESAVVHLGQQRDAGHYVALARDGGLFGGRGGWVVHDDMRAPSPLPLPAFPDLKSLHGAGVRLERDAYILFYALALRPSPRPPPAHSDPRREEGAGGAGRRRRKREDCCLM